MTGLRACDHGARALRNEITSIHPLNCTFGKKAVLVFWTIDLPKSRGVNMWHRGGMPMSLLGKALNRVLRLFGRKLPPESDPYSYVMAPKKPRPPYRSATAVAEPPE